MLKKILLLIIANFIFVVLVIAVYGIGYQYDQAHKLYPEMKWMSYDWGMSVYGERWVRVAYFSLIVGGIADAVVLIGWLRNWSDNRTTTLDLH